ncbi:hypothetical protein [Halobacillus mangrovi]|uniref:hypothetical protein n=1 Tax=Halobacillus mangrovi TaxID=402384 RepID=UPI003D983962
MAKHVEAFFKNENDAESAKAELQKLTIENEMVEAIPEDRDLSMVIPLQSSSGTAGATTNFVGALETDNDPLNDQKHLTHILHFQVQEEQYDRAVKIIEQHKGHMESVK